MNFYIKKPNLTKTILAVGRVGGLGVARVSDFFYYFFSKESKSENNCFLFERVEVREDWLVSVSEFYKESKSKTKRKNISSFFVGAGVRGRGSGVRGEGVNRWGGEG